MKSVCRPAAKSPARLALLVGSALALGTVSASALTANLAGATNSKQVTVSEETIAKMGKVLDVNGKAVYVLTPAGSTCDSACLAIWPALTLPASVSSATAGKGVQQGKLGTTVSNGVRQVTYQGQPLYFFSKDARGKVKGNVTDQWGKWTAVVVAKAPSSSGSNAGSSGTNAGSGGASF